MINNDSVKAIADNAALVQIAVIRSRVESLAEAIDCAWSQYRGAAISIMHNPVDDSLGVHLVDRQFREIYPVYTVTERECDAWPFELSVHLGAVKIFALSETP